MSKDLTSGSIHRHLLSMALPMMIGMAVQSLYLFVDMYFVARLGPVAVAAVGAGTAVFFLILALTQMLNIGAVSLIARATGAGDAALANRVFVQAMWLGLVLGGVTVLAGFGLMDQYLAVVTTDPTVQQAGREFLSWYIPGLALSFLVTAIGAALRAVGVVKPTMQVQLLTVLVNIVLAPVLIEGIGTGVAFGVAGAGAATLLATLVGVLLLWRYFRQTEHPVLASHNKQIDLQLWRRLLAIGAPAGGEYALMFVYMSLVYWLIKDTGTEQQAAFGIGMRIVQALSLPAVALSFALPAIAGQNLGAGLHQRVLLTRKAGLQLCLAMMLLAFALCQLLPAAVVGLLTSDSAVIVAGAVFLKIISWNFLTGSVVLISSGMFQALGNTVPALGASLVRVGCFFLPAWWFSQQAGFQVEHVWWCAVLAVVLQMLVSHSWLALLLRTMVRGGVPGPAGLDVRS